MATKTDNVKVVLEAVGSPQVQSALAGVSESIKGLGIAAGALVTVNSIGNFLAESIKAAAESERSYHRLASTMNRLGGDYSSMSFGVEKFTSQLQRQSEVTDEQAADALNRLFIATQDMTLSMKAATVAADVAASTDMDFSSIVNLLTRSTAGSIEVFKRYGIVINQADFEARGLSSIIDQLTTQFGGAAKANTETLSGAIHQLATQYGELQEAIGSKFGVTGAIAGMAEGFSELATIIKDSKSPLSDLIAIFSAGSASGLELLNRYNQVTAQQAALAKQSIPMVGEIVVTAKSLEREAKDHADALDQQLRALDLREAALNRFPLKGITGPAGGLKSIPMAEGDEASRRLAEQLNREHLRREADAYSAHYAEIKAMAEETAQSFSNLFAPVTNGLVDAFFGASVQIEDIFKNLLADLAKQLLASAVFSFIKMFLLPGITPFTGSGATSSLAGGGTSGGVFAPPISPALSGGGNIYNTYVDNGSSRNQAALATAIIQQVQQSSRAGALAIQSSSSGVSTGLERSVAFNLGVARG